MKKYLSVLILAGAILLGASAPAMADGVGKIIAIVNQIFGGTVDGTGASTGQAIVKQADGSWKPGTISSTNTLAQTLALGNATGGSNISFTFGDRLSFTDSGGTFEQIYSGAVGALYLNTNAGALFTLDAPNNNLTIQSTGHTLTLVSPAISTGLTLTGVTITGAPTWSSSQGITLSTAAQPNITSVGTLVGLTMTGTLAMSSTPVISGSPACTLGATTVTTLGMGGTLTVGANTLSLASSTVSGTPTWSSNQAITLSTAAQGNVTSLGTLTGLTMGGTLTMGANTLALASATISGTPTWSSNQAITLSTAAQGNVTSLGTLTALTLSGTLTCNSSLAQGFTTGGFLLPNCLTGAPSGAAANNNMVVGADNHLWVRLNGTWSQLDAQSGVTPTLGAVVNAGNTVNGTAASGRFTWNTGGTYAAGSTSQVYGNTDGVFFISAGVPGGSTAGRGITLTASDGSTSGSGGPIVLNAGSGISTDDNAGGVTINSGNSRGFSTGTITFKVPPASNASGSTLNTSTNALTLNCSGYTFLAAPLNIGLANAAGSITGIAGQSGTGTAGAITWTAGPGGTTSGAGGIFTDAGGAVTTTSSAGNGGAANHNGGSCTGTTTTGNGGASLCTGGSGGTTSGTGGAFSGVGGAGTGSTSGVGGLASLIGGAGSTASNNNASGGVVIDIGNSSGNATETILFKGPPTGSSGATLNTSIGLISISNTGRMLWQTGLTAASSGAPDIGGSTDRDMFISSGGGTAVRNLTISSGVNVGSGNVTIQTPSPATSASGQITIQTGNAQAAGNSTGSITLTTGNSTTTFAAGSITGTGGVGGTTGVGGAITWTGGQGGSNSAGGAVSAIGGAGVGATSGVGGLATLQGGAGSTASNNNNSGGVTITTGLPSGTGTGNIKMQTGFTLASGASVQTAGDRYVIAGHNVTMSTTTATATGIVVLNVPTSNSSGGCVVQYQVSANDGTNWNTATGSFAVACSNKAGTVTATASAITDEATNNNSGTLTAGTTSTTVASQAVTIKIAPAWTVITPGAGGVICTVTVTCFGNGVTVTPQ